MLDPTTAEELADLIERFALDEGCHRAIEALVLRSQGRPVTPSAMPTMMDLTQADGTAEPVEPSWPPEPPAMDRYECEYLLGVGGVGEVWRVYDPQLRRRLALKVLRPHLTQDAVMIARFLEEARLTAQLQHPGVVAVHSTGVLTDGRRYFTMTEVAGRTLRDIIRDLHLQSTGQRWAVTGDGWSLRRALGAFRQVCQTIAYAHGRGVLHRDLKPSNVMLGAYGEVLVLDWGLARVDGRAEEAPTLQVREDGEDLTLAGAIPGTPSYMSPEQIAGDPDDLGPPADVYALGAMLHELLCGHPPYNGSSAQQILQRSRRGPPLRPSQVSNGVPVPPERTDEIGSPGPPVPPELEEVCARAMARDPANRYADADALGREIAAWLDGERRQDQASALVAAAAVQQDDADRKRAEAAALREEATAQLAPVPPYAAVAEKRPGWARQDRAEALEREAELQQLEYVQTLRAALHQAPDHVEALRLLADHYAERHRAAEARRDQRRADAVAVLLRSYDRGQYRAYLAGHGRLSLQTLPAGARVKLYRYTRWERRLVPAFLKQLGDTPLVDVSLPVGSYMLELHARKRMTVRLPVSIGRQQRWTLCPPGADTPIPARMPFRGALGEDECYVPAGWFDCGGDAEAEQALPAQSVWIGDFVMRRYPVTNAEYLAFLNDLVDKGRADEALQRAPRERTGTQGTPGELIYGRDGDGRFILVPDADGDQWQRRWPVLKVDWHGARAYAAWLAEETGQPWRLPTEREWEKAARGPDGRFFPWGDFLDPSFCCMQRSHGPERRLPADVEGYPVDTSPYGVRGMAGNARDWCLDPWLPEGLSPRDGGRDRDAAELAAAAAERRVCRGGAWWQRASHSRVASRRGVRDFLRDVGISFRLVRPL